MQTRSQTKKMCLIELPVNIDFDGASRAWLANKRRLGNGTYEYKKEEIKTKGYYLRSRKEPIV
jgi:hypothetical protein